jgi:hypothetical protein
MALTKIRETIPREVTEYKEKFFFGLTARQLVCIGGCLAITIPTGIYGNKILPNDLVQWIVILEALPFAAFGFINFDGQSVEKVFLKALKFYIMPQKDIIFYKSSLYLWQEGFTKAMLNAEKYLEKEERKKRKKGTKHRRANPQSDIIANNTNGDDKDGNNT